MILNSVCCVVSVCWVCVDGVIVCIQRPTAHELLKHRFLKVARKTSYLTELIDRYQSWRVESGETEEQDDSVDGGR